MQNITSNSAIEAKTIIQEVASVYLAHTKQWFIGLVVHGSAVKGGFIKGWSDIDFQLYLEDSAFNENGQLPFQLCVSIHRELSKIDPFPFQYIQCRVLSPSFSQYGGLVPNTYELVSGKLLVPETTNEQLYEKAKKELTELNPSRLFTASCLLDHGDDRLQKNVRAFCTAVYPILFHVLTLQQKDGVEVWRLNKMQAIELLSEDTPLGEKIHAFYRAVLNYYPNTTSVEDALSVVETGIDFLQTAKKWWDKSFDQY